MSNEACKIDSQKANCFAWKWNKFNMYPIILLHWGFFILTTFQKLTHNVAILRIYLAVVFQEGVPGF